jgi:Trp operon repressor
MKQQPYDSSMKALFQADAPEILPQILPGAIFVDKLDIEVLRPPQRVDRVYQIYYHDKPHILHLEFQASSDEEMDLRLLFCHVGFLRDYKRQPVISMVIYLFKTNTPTPPYREVSGKQEILTFHYQVLELWKLDARKYMQQHIMSMYTLLPMMDHVDAPLLLQAVNELVVYHKDNESKKEVKLGDRLVWFRAFLMRAETISKEEKEKVRKRLDAFNQIMEESEFAVQQRAIGKEQGKTEGEVEISRVILLDTLQTRFPELAARMRTRILQNSQIEKLRKVINLVIQAADEQNALRALDILLTQDKS